MTGPTYAVDLPEFDAVVDLPETDAVVDLAEFGVVVDLSEIDAVVEDLLVTVTIVSALPPPPSTPAIRVVGALSGHGALFVAATPRFAGSGDLSGVGDLAATATPIIGVTAALSGSGTPSATVTASYASTASLSGSGSLSATATAVYAISASLTGVGSLSATVSGKAAGLLGEWGFLDNLNDTSGNGHTGTFTAGAGGSLTYGSGPQANTRAVTFSHVNDFISFGRAGLEPTADGLTTMGWMKLVNGADAPSAGLVGLLSKAKAAASSRSRIGYKMLSNARTAAYVARWKDNLHNSDTITPAPDAGWHHIALVDGNTDWSLYVDGVLTSATGTRAFDNTTSPIWENFPWVVGRNTDIGDQYAGPNLSVSGIRIFQGQLTATQIQAWMNTPVT